MRKQRDKEKARDRETGKEYKEKGKKQSGMWEENEERRNAFLIKVTLRGSSCGREGSEGL